MQRLGEPIRAQGEAFSKLRPKGSTKLAKMTVWGKRRRESRSVSDRRSLEYLGEHYTMVEQ